MNKFIAYITILLFHITNCSMTVKQSSTIKSRLAIDTIIANGIQKSISEELSLKLYKKLSAKMGNDRILFRKSKISKSANRILIGRISKFGNKISVTINIAHGETGKVLFTKTSTMNRIDLDKIISDISKQIIKNREIWE